MKIIISPNLYKLPFSRYRLPPGGIKELLARNPEWINAYTISLFFILCSFLLGLRVRAAWVLSLSWLIFLILNYFYTWLCCRSLSISRNFPLQAREGDRIDIVYSIVNQGSFSLRDISLKDAFSGTQALPWEISLVKKLRGRYSRNLLHSITLDNGMGEKSFDKLEVLLRDFLGIFTFRVIFDENASINVLPLVSPFPHGWERAKDETPNFGLLEVDKKGDSTNFVDLREYRDGDALRSINWMASLRADKILVNEFDQMVDSHLTIFLNNDSRANSGVGANSSFEYSRDLALTIAEDQLVKGNMLRLVTCDQVHHMGRGNDFFHFLESHLSSLSLSSIENRSAYYSSERFFDFVPSGGTLVYLSPIHHLPYLQKDLQILKGLAQDNRRVIVLFINPYPYLFRLIKGQGRITVAGLLEGAKGFYSKIEELLLTHGIFVYQIEVDERKSFQKVLARLGLRHLLYQESFK